MRQHFRTRPMPARQATWRPLGLQMEDINLPNGVYPVYNPLNQLEVAKYKGAVEDANAMTPLGYHLAVPSIASTLDSLKGPTRLDPFPFVPLE